MRLDSCCFHSVTWDCWVIPYTVTFLLHALWHVECHRLLVVLVAKALLLDLLELLLLPYLGVVLLHRLSLVLPVLLTL